MGWLLVFELACSDPEPGDPCEPGSPAISFGLEDDRPSFCGPQVIDMLVLADTTAPCRLFCAGPAGCSGEADFHWKVVPYEPNYAPGSEWCGCDGRTGSNGWRVPNGGRWQWYGSCEEPCDRVYHTGTRWAWDINLDAEELNPVCTACSEAMVVDGRCVHPDGFAMPTACCHCYLEADGSCRSTIADDFAVAPNCCDGMTYDP
jgi:hypothetical protein